MWHWRFIGGFAISIGGGQIVIWPLMKLLRWYSKAPQHISLKNQRGLSWVTGIVEEGLYTSALIVGAYQWIGIWLAMKVAARWKSEEKVDSNLHIWLIGSGLSVLFGFLGAWFALGKLPCLK
ncbi:MAG: hypothetical protein WA197_18435 [Candidatus Acidiferrales bacterium]